MASTLWSLGTPIAGVTGGLTKYLPMISSLAEQGQTLSAAASVARTLGGIPKLEKPISANEIIRRVRAAGGKVQRQAALKVISQLRAKIRARSYIQGLNPNRNPIASRLEYGTVKQTARYKYLVLVEGRDKATGRPVTQWITYNTNRLASKTDAEFFAAAAVNIGGSGQGLEALNATTIDILRAPNIRSA